MYPMLRYVDDSSRPRNLFILIGFSSSDVTPSNCGNFYYLAYEGHNKLFHFIVQFSLVLLLLIFDASPCYPVSGMILRRVQQSGSYQVRRR